MPIKDYFKNRHQFSEEDFEVTNPLTPEQLKWLKIVSGLVMILFVSYLGYMIWMFNNVAPLPPAQTEEIPTVSAQE